MNLRQLQYITEVAKHGLNISATAESLYTSQPGVSKQILQLEEELGVKIFERRGRQLTRVTPEGQVILRWAARALTELESLKQAAREYSDPDTGTLSLATTHTVARFLFPRVIKRFAAQFPGVGVHLHIGTPAQIAEMVDSGAVDFGIATEAMAHFENLAAMPCYRWRRCVLVPEGHALCGAAPLTLAAVAEYPIITYVFGFDRGAPIEAAFRRAGLSPQVRYTATDADVIKALVRYGLGVGIVAALAHDPDHDEDLCALDGSHLFEVSTARIVFRRGTYFRGYLFRFLELFAPHLNREAVETGLSLHGAANLDALFVDTELPLF